MYDRSARLELADGRVASAILFTFGTLPAEAVEHYRPCAASY